MNNKNEFTPKKERCIVCGVFMGTGKIDDSDFDSLEELKELCIACGAEVVGETYQSREAIDPRTVIGKGKVEEIKNAVKELEADIVVFDCELSGSNTRNLESELGARVLDRSRLILDIFALRATTKEGKCQVELAQLEYNLPRLSGLGTSLSRLGGGIGTRGPGETKLESDKRHIRERIQNLKRELREIDRTRETMRKKGIKSEIPGIALVGYTNAGKSSLLNALTNSEQFVKNMLFATLDPLSKKMTLSDGREAVITDTVGFIRKLPHHLIDAFRSTLEEAKYADIILHVVDSSNPQIDAQMEIVYDTLNHLGVKEKPVITFFNKQDRFEGEKPIFKDLKADYIVEGSVKTKQGLDKLVETIEKILKERSIYIEHTFPYSDAGKLQLIRKYGQLISEEYVAEGIFVKANVPPEVYGQLGFKIDKGEEF